MADVPSTSKQVAPVKKGKRKSRLLRLEKKLKNLQKQIKRFQETELSLDDMNEDDSPYLRCDYLMQKFVRTWEEICFLTKSSPQIFVQIPESYSGTDFEVINKKVQKIVDEDIFPDYNDIVELLEHYDMKKNLHIPKETIPELAKQVFRDVGKLVKKKRRQDFLHHFGCHLTDRVRMEEDPAISDKQLLGELQEYDREGTDKLEKLLDEFAVKQDIKRGASSEQTSESEEEEQSEDDEPEKLLLESDEHDGMEEGPGDVQKAGPGDVQEVGPNGDEEEEPDGVEERPDDDEEEGPDGVEERPDDDEEEGPDCDEEEGPDGVEERPDDDEERPDDEEEGPDGDEEEGSDDDEGEGSNEEEEEGPDDDGEEGPNGGVSAELKNLIGGTNETDEPDKDVEIPNNHLSRETGEKVAVIVIDDDSESTPAKYFKRSTDAVIVLSDSDSS